MSNGILQDIGAWDRRGWRLFGENDIKKIEMEAEKID